MSNQPWHTPGYLKLSGAWAYLITQRNLGYISESHWQQCIQVLMLCGRLIREERKQQWANWP
jgi:hypothetical protein